MLQVTFRIKSTIEEESTESVVKTRRGRPPNKSSSELTLHELKTYVNNEMKKVWEGLESPGGALQLHLYGGMWPQDWKIDPSAD